MQRHHGKQRHAHPADTVDHQAPAQAKKVLLSLQYSQEHWHPGGEQQHRQRQPERDRVGNLQVRQDASLEQQYHQRTHQPYEECSQPHRADQPREFMLASDRQRVGSLLGKDNLERQRLNEHRHDQEHTKLAVRVHGQSLGQEMHGGHEQPARHGGEHQPAALAEERGAVGIGLHDGGFDLFSEHGHLERGGEVAVQEKDWRKRNSSLLPRSSSSREIHSSTVCACAMSPGPNTTLGMPPCPSTDASQK